MEEKIYGAHPDIARMAREYFASHVMDSGPGYSWMFRTPGKTSYWFRVTWAPGIVTVSGDIGDITYRGGSSDLWDTIEWVAGGDYCYLTGKTKAKKEFDAKATEEELIRIANHEAIEVAREWWSDVKRDYHMFQDEIPFYDHWTDAKNMNRHPGYSLWSRLADATEWSCDMTVAKNRRRVKDDLYKYVNSQAVYGLGIEDFYGCHEYTAETRWCYEAARHWAKTMLAKEPRWHWAWRRWKFHISNLKRSRRYITFNPDIYTARDGKEFNGSRKWTLVHRKKWADDDLGITYLALYPFRPFGIDMSRFGLWTTGGSTWSVLTKNDDRFVPITEYGGVPGLIRRIRSLLGNHASGRK